MENRIRDRNSSRKRRIASRCSGLEKCGKRHVERTVVFTFLAPDQLRSVGRRVEINRDGTERFNSEAKPRILLVRFLS